MQVNDLGDFSPEVQTLVSSPESIRKILELAENCRSDESLLGKLNQQGDQTREKAFADFGIDDRKELETVFVANADEVEHFVIPPDPNAALNDENLVSITGGSTASTAGTLGTAGSVLTFTSLSSVSSAFCAGCAGSAG